MSTTQSTTAAHESNDPSSRSGGRERPRVLARVQTRTVRQAEHSRVDRRRYFWCIILSAHGARMTTAIDRYGLWWNPSSPDEMAAGRVIRAGTGPIVLEMLAPTTSGWGPSASGMASISSGADAVPMLVGTLNDGGYATALGCSFAGFTLGTSQTNRVRVRHLLVGIQLKDPAERVFRRIEVQVPALVGLLGVPWPEGPFPRVHVGSKHMRLTYDTRRHTWVDGDLRTTFEYAPAIGLSAAAAALNLVPRIVVVSRAKRSLVDLLDGWLYPLADVVMLATGSAFQPTQMRLWMSGSRRLGRTDPAFALFTDGMSSGEEPVDWPDRPPLFGLEQLISSTPAGIAEVVRRTQAMQEGHQLFVALIRETIVRDKPIQNRFLDLVSALEAFHGRAVGDRMSIDDFKQERSVVLKAADPGHRKFLKTWLPSIPQTSLPKKIAELRGRVGPRQWTVTHQTMADLRNDLAHGNSPSGERLTELDQATTEAFDLARLLALKEVGVAP